MSSDASSVSLSDQIRSLDLSATLTEIWMNGIAACITFVALHALYFGRDPSLRKYIWSIIVVLLYTSSTIQMGLAWATTINPIIQFGGTPNLPDALATVPPWAEAVDGTLFSLNILIADVVFIWRCWAVWERRWMVTVIPILATVAGIILSVLSLIGEVEEDIIGVSATAAVSKDSSFVKFFTPYLALSMGTTLYTTCMIIGRILSVTIGVRESGIKRSLFGRYSVIMEILVESALLYSLTILIFVVFLARADEDNIYPDSILSQVSCISPTLIILRVALGHAKVDDRTSHYAPTSLAFAARTAPAQVSAQTTEGYGLAPTSDGSTKLSSSDPQNSSGADEMFLTDKV